MKSFMHSKLMGLKQVVKYLLGRSSIVDIRPVCFSGWKMATGTYPPWNGGGGNDISRAFTQCDLELRQLIKTPKVLLTQFRENAVEVEVAALRWRHYFVYWSARYAMRQVHVERKNFAEVGVCDGLTAWYATRAIMTESVGENKFFLYDAWEGMREDLLVGAEKKSTGSYAYLDVNNTKRNLASTGYSHFVYNKGYIPESFDISENPDTLAWLHIDLNSVLPTMAALDFFWPKLVAGGLVLLDDFAWPGYEDTKIEVEKWCVHHECMLMHLPTGQAILFK